MERDRLARQIKAIHTAPLQLVLEFAGAGVQALAWLHSQGGSSRTVLEATDRYAAPAMVSLVGFQPEQFTSAGVARAMAAQAYVRACQLAAPGLPAAGVGCTATIATDRVKRGDHRCFVAGYDNRGIAIYSLTLRKGQRTRQEEEETVSLLILRLVSRLSGLAELPMPALVEGETLVESLELLDLPARLLQGDFNWLLVRPEGSKQPGQILPGVALLSGAFNPLHEGHRRLAEVAAARLGQPVLYELPLVNADKAPIGAEEAARRLGQFANLAPVLLTRAPLFGQKALLFPHSTFVIGVDTVKRLIEPRFYEHDPAKMRASLASVRRAGCRFLVAGRLREDTFLSLADVALPAGYRELFEAIPESQFRADISSTAIRTGQVEPAP